MHDSSLRNLSQFVNTYLQKFNGQSLKAADIGSQDINGCYRSLFDKPGWSYVGLDVVAGKNVDVVLSDLYSWTEIDSQSFDVVICGQVLEHVEFFWITMLEIRRILKPLGLCCIIAPSSGAEHRYPVDCWRFYPDGMRALARYADLTVLETYAEWDQERFPGMNAEWKDCVLIAQRPNL